MATSEDKEMKQSSGLYQAFLKLYEHHRSLLDEILKLENLDLPPLRDIAPHYMQGVIQGQQAYLVTNLREGLTQTIGQPQQVWTIGRNSTCAIPIADKQLSRRHAAIQYIDRQGFYLTDLKSTNGTFVNGESVVQRLLLKDGDQVRLGGVKFFFFVGSHFHTLAPVSPEVLTHLKAISTGTPVAHYHTSAPEALNFNLPDCEPEIPTAPVEETPQSKDSKDSLDESSRFLRQEGKSKKPVGTPAWLQVDREQRAKVLDRFRRNQRPEDPS